MIDAIAVYIKNNVSWIFSGIGVAVLGAIFGLIWRRHHLKQRKLVQKSGQGSINLQAGGDMKIETHRE